MPPKISNTIPVTPELLRQMHDEIRRTGVHPDRLIVRADIKPRNLTASTVEDWFEAKFESGGTAQANKTHIDFLMMEWAKLPTQKNTKVRLKYQLDASQLAVPVSDDYIARIGAHIIRTGVSTQHLFKRRPDAPQGLNVTIVTAWMKGRTKTAPPYLMQWLEQAYKQLPTTTKVASKKPPVVSGDRVPLTKDHKLEIEIHKRRTGLSYAEFYDAVKDEAPEGFTPRIVSQWIGGQTNTADKAVLDYVLRHWRRMGDKP